MSGATLKGILLSCSICTVLARRNLEHLGVEVLAGATGCQCPTVKQVDQLSDRIPEEHRSLFEPLAKTFRKIGHDRKGSDYFLAMVNDEHVVRFQKAGFQLELIRMQGWFYSTFAVCYWKDGDTAPEQTQRFKYEPKSVTTGHAVDIGVDDYNERKIRLKEMPDGVVAQNVGGPRGRRPGDIEFRASNTDGFVPTKVWELLHDKDAVGLHREFEGRFHFTGANEQAQNVVEDFKKRFQDLGIGIHFCHHYSKTRDGSFRVDYRWLEYARLDNVPSDYKPGSPCDRVR
jgi:hypothetical protein